MNHNTITIGGRSFTGEELRSGSCYIAEGIAGEELAVDTLEAEVESADDLTVLAYGTAADYTHDGDLIGRFYLSSVKRTGASRYALSCVSAIGLLDGSRHRGGLYTGQTVGEALEDIIESIVPYTVNAQAASVRLYGWLPYATRRENLHQVLFATGASLKKDGSGELEITFLTASDPSAISADRIYLGGSIDYKTPATEVQVTEHSYFASANDATNTLFDNTDGSGAVSAQLVTFDGPHHDLTATSGLTIVDSGVNYAVLTGTGTLTGSAYTHQTKIITKAAEGAAGAENVVSVSDATLVSLVNSENVAERVLAYYSAAYHATVGLVVGAERPGDPVSYTNPFGEEDTGLIKSMDINLSNTLKADTVITSGYDPSAGGNYFEHVVVLTGSGTWNPPAELIGKKGRAVLIGGPDGGDGGGNGGAGVSVSMSALSYQGSTVNKSPGNGGAGGKGGAGKPGGKVLSENFEITGPITYSAGVGGAAGAAGGGRGGTGTESVFGALTSANGAPAVAGFVEIITGEVYALPGTDGADGAAGGNGGSAGARGTDGKDSDTAAGGSSVSGWSQSSSWVGTSKCGGSGGGGAAYNTPGGNAVYSYGSGSTGGAGASPAARTPHTALGSGGHGGHGGGGGGGGAGASYAPYGDKDPGNIINNPGGAAGKGTPGTAGQPGCIIVYY